MAASFRRTPRGTTSTTVSPFFRKVMGLLFAMVTLTTCITTYVVVYASVQTRVWWVQQWLAYGWLVIPVEVLAATLLQQYKKEYPYNYLLLLFLNLSTSITVAVVCAVYASRGQAALLVEALQITAFFFGGLATFAVQSKYDFTPWNTGCSILLLGLLWWNLAEVLFGIQTSSDLTLVGAALFCAFVVVDIQLVLTRIGPDDAVHGAILLYLDLMNLFLYMLKLLNTNASTSSNQRGRREKKNRSSIPLYTSPVH